MNFHSWLIDNQFQEATGSAELLPPRATRFPGFPFLEKENFVQDILNSHIKWFAFVVKFAANFPPNFSFVVNWRFFGEPFLRKEKKKRIQENIAMRIVFVSWIIYLLLYPLDFLF